MQKHVKIYLEYFGKSTADFVGCEICNSKAVDIHHIIPRSKFGSKTKDEQDKIENLIALCRNCHNEAHANSFSKEQLTEIHKKNL